MFFVGTREPEPDLHLHDDPQPPTSPTPCSQGHRSTLSLPTLEGGSICLLCFSNLVSDPRAPTVHVSYALSQLSIAISQPPFLRSLLSSHPHFLVSPLVHALSSFDDDPIASQTVDLISTLCTSGESSIQGEFVSRISGELSSGALAWSRRQLYMLHCFGVLTNCQGIDFFANIQDKISLVHNLVAGLQLPSEEIRGEVLYVLYKLAVLQYVHGDGDGADVLLTFCPDLLVLSLEVLAKTQRDDVRLNCIALLTILAQRDVFELSRSKNVSNVYLGGEIDNYMRKTITDGSAVHSLLAEAVKGPLLSTDREVQISALDLIFHYLSQEGFPLNEIQILIEENIADYVFEILRLSECKDPVVRSCLRVLGLFSTAEQAFRKRLVIGFASVITVLGYVAEIPFHPSQVQTLALISDCISDYPGVASSSHVKEIVIVLSRMLKRYYSEEVELLPDAFKNICSILVYVIRTPSFSRVPELIASLQESLRHAILASLSFLEKDSDQILHGLCLLKEAYACCHELYSEGNPDAPELKNCILDVCVSDILPWFLTVISEPHEEITASVMETFNFILLLNSHLRVRELAEVMVSEAWFSFSFGCLGYLSTEKIRLRVYEVFGSLVDILLGEKKGQPIRDAAPCLPSDPVDLLFLLGQDSSNNPELSTCQSAVLLILHTGSLANDRLAEDKLILEALENYVLVNGTTSETISLLNLYGLYRGLKTTSCRIPCSREAERIIFSLLSENDWNLHLAEIHPVALKWFFQQERVDRALSYQILKLCKYNASNGNQLSVDGENRKNLDVLRIAELVAAEDTHAAPAFVSLLIEIAEAHEQENNVILVLRLMKSVICLYPSASDQLYLHGVGNAIQTVCSSIYSSSQDVFMALLLLIFNLLSSVHPNALGSEDSWVAVTMKLVNCLISRDCQWIHEDLFIIGIFCLIAHHSSTGAFTEAAKLIVLNSALTSAINSTLSAACSKGPALSKYDEGTNAGFNLTFSLLLYYFSMRSLPAVLPAALHWQSFFHPSNEAQTLSMTDICSNLCRLMQFGHLSLKLAASYSLLESLTILSERTDITNELKHRTGYLRSMMAVLEGLIFYEDRRVSMNCALCLTRMLAWGEFGLPEILVIAKSHNWYRLIAEEVSMSLAVPSLASKTFSNYYKPAVYVTVALLRLSSRPEWMKIVFDDPCKSGLIRNITMTNISPEVVLLFRELLNARFLNEEHIASLHKVFVACKKHMYAGETWNTWDDPAEKDTQKTGSSIDDVAEACKYLIHLMSSESLLHVTSFGKSQNQKKLLLDEIDKFFRASTGEDGNCAESLD